MKIVVGARESKLSLQQVKEVLLDLRQHQQDVDFEVITTATKGDRDLKTSLKKMDKTNFFTQEIDALQLAGKCRVSIHSAKDLPDPLPQGLQLIALTHGKDASDVLVMREGESIASLKKNGRIGSSSKRRDAMVRDLRSDLQCVDIRGTIEMRLKPLFKKQLEGVVIAEAALIRLGLTHLNRCVLPGEAAPLQGKLAIVARQGDHEMKHLFAPLNTYKRQKMLYTGLSVKHVCSDKDIHHIPMIQVVPRPYDHLDIQRAFMDLEHYTHLIFTSKSAVEIFFSYLKRYGSHSLAEKRILAIGKVTAQVIESYGAHVDQVAQEETQEGMIRLLALEHLDQAYILLPQSAKARSTLAQFLMLRGVRHQRCILYDTQTRVPKDAINLAQFDEIMFTSPSTVDAFFEVFGSIPRNKKMTAIGPITEHKLKSFLD